MTPVVINSEAMKNPIISQLISHHNDAGLNEMVTIKLVRGFFFADGSTTFNALTTEEFDTAMAGIYSIPAIVTQRIDMPKQDFDTRLAELLLKLPNDSRVALSKWAQDSAHSLGYDKIIEMITDLVNEMTLY